MTAPRDADAAVVRRPLPDTTPGVTTATAIPQPGPTAAPPLAGVAVPPGHLYVCVTSDRGTQRQVGIQFAGKVQQLCERHPEMGPCQYERNACRQGGGRVFDTAGREITLATEAEYDRKVTRIRFRAN